MDQARLIEGGLAVNHRSQVPFVNDFDFQGVNRLNVGSNHRGGFVRVRNAHRNFAELVYLATGSVRVGAVRIDDWERYFTNFPVQGFILTVSRPSVLCIPMGFVNGFMSLEQQAYCVISDSGTVKEECAVIGVPNATIREVTKRSESVECVSKTPDGADSERVQSCVKMALASGRDWPLPLDYLRETVSQTVAKIGNGYQWGDALAIEGGRA